MCEQEENTDQNRFPNVIPVELIVDSCFSVIIYTYRETRRYSEKTTRNNRHARQSVAHEAIGITDHESDLQQVDEREIHTARCLQSRLSFR